MTQAYISKLWLVQNIRADMNILDVVDTILNAPVVEFDPDEPPQHGRCGRCDHYKGAMDAAVGTCGYWPGFVAGDDWCSNYVRHEEPPKEET